MVDEKMKATARAITTELSEFIKVRAPLYALYEKTEQLIVREEFYVLKLAALQNSLIARVASEPPAVKLFNVGIILSEWEITKRVVPVWAENKDEAAEKVKTYFDGRASVEWVQGALK